jgi:hypothetical protein
MDVTALGRNPSMGETQPLPPKRSIMQKYSDFFQTLHDEQTPTGTLGRGTHYSILRAVVFQDEEGKALAEAEFFDFAVIWDEDHDLRVIEAIQRIYIAGLLPRFTIFGERKGCFTAIIKGEFKDESQREWLSGRVHAITCNLDNDSWPASSVELDSPDNKIISDTPERVNLYIENLIMLWELGLKSAYQPQVKSPQLLSA